MFSQDVLHRGRGCRVRNLDLDLIADNRMGHCCQPVPVGNIGAGPNVEPPEMVGATKDAVLHERIAEPLSQVGAI